MVIQYWNTALGIVVFRSSSIIQIHKDMISSMLMFSIKVCFNMEANCVEGEQVMAPPTKPGNHVQSQQLLSGTALQFNQIMEWREKTHQIRHFLQQTKNPTF